jgi:hypothetical protein
MFTNLQPAVRADGSLGPWREWCPACHDVMVAAIAGGGTIGFQTAGIAKLDTTAKYHAAVEDGLATYPLRFLETQPDAVDAHEPYLLTDPGAVQDRVAALAHHRATTTEVACGPATVNEATTCTATVTELAGSPVETPGGAVTWSASGGGTLDPTTCTPTGSGATASCSVAYTPSPGSAGTHAVSAAYGGDVSHLVSDDAIALTVTRRATTTTVSCGTPVPAATPTTCTATVSDAGAGALAPTGTVSWAGPGSFSPSTCTLGGGPADASCSVAFTPSQAGTHTVAATYGADADHLGSSGSGVVVADKHATSTSLSCVSPASMGFPTTCTATVSDLTGSLTPSGTVSWASDSTGAFSSSTCTLSGGECSVQYTPGALGTHQISASYGGGTNHDPSDALSFALEVVSEPPPDVTPPSVTITSPLNGATVPKGKGITIRADASDDRGVVRVEFWVGTSLKCTDTTAAYTCWWRVPSKAGAKYTVKAVAYDAAGNSAFHAIVVTAR